MLWELGDKLSSVLGQRRDTPDNENGAGDGNRTHTVGASEHLKQAVWCDRGFQVRLACEFSRYVGQRRAAYGHTGGRNLGQPPYFRSFDRYGSSKPCSLLAMKGRPAGNKLGILTTCNSTHSRMKRSR
jgi:hypothetical protein